MPFESSRIQSRRAILAAALGGTAAALLGLFSRPQPAAAADGDPVLIGEFNQAQTLTAIEAQTGSVDVLRLRALSSGTALYARATSGYGAHGHSPFGSGVYGESDTGHGVLGTTNSGRGVSASSNTGAAVYGDSNSGTGVYGESNTGFGVEGVGYSTTLPAVLGYSFGGNTGAQGYSGTNQPTTTPSKTGLFGSSDQDSASIGVSGFSPAGRGGQFKGGAAQLKLVPSTASTHPATGQRGDLFVDKNGRLWFCKGGSTWKQLA